MDSELADQVASSTPFSGAGSAFSAPLPSEASNALKLLVGADGTVNDNSLELRLSNTRLGVASSLFRALKLKHPPTAKHCLRVALGCSVMASHLRLDDRTREQLEIAALLHDIGKLGVPDQILNKPARLDDVEYRTIEQHTSFAVHILESCCDDLSILDIVRYAGTWYDGSRPGNSDVSGEALPLGARILAIQNAFDAMTTDLVYRQALPHDRAIAELFENASKQFDPALVTAFCDANATNLQSEVGRRWVDMSTSDTDQLWSFAAPVIEGSTNTQTIFQKRLLESMHDGVVFVDTTARIMVWNQGAESLTGLSTESVHHKLWQPQIIDFRDMEGNALKPKRCPLLGCFATMEEAVHRLTLTNRGKKTRVAVNAHTMPVVDATGTCHGAILILHDVSPEHTLEERVQNLHTRATRDALTGVGNRAEFDRRHAELVETHLETGEPLGLVICDIDKFKLINDTYGHQAGDAALIEFASLIDRQSRGNDLVARYGGEEFVLLCPGCTDDLAYRKAEEIRHILAATPQPALRNTKMTASFGVTTLIPGDNPEAMLKRADEGLYEAKESGRNRVILVGPNSGKSSKKSSWFSSWVTGKSQDEKLLNRRLACTVPVNVVAEKVRGFISDNKAEVVGAEESVVILNFDERSMPNANTQRRQTDRPFVYTMKIEFAANPDANGRTLIDVTIFTKRGRERRQDDIVERATGLMNAFKAYLIAEEVA